MRIRTTRTIANTRLLTNGLLLLLGLTTTPHALSLRTRVEVQKTQEINLWCRPRRTFRVSNFVLCLPAQTPAVLQTFVVDTTLRGATFIIRSNCNTTALVMAEEPGSSSFQSVSETHTKRSSTFRQPPFRHFESYRKELKQVRTTPVLAFTALGLAALTTILSLGLLLAVRDRPVWPTERIYSVVQPASCLSVLLAFCGFCLNIALSEGAAITWWRQACKEDATVGDLHLAWAAGMSRFDALRTRAWRRYKYLSFATIAILIIPINGFFLQAAISTKLVNQVHGVNITIPMVPFLDLGFSATNVEAIDPVDLSGSGWQLVWEQFENVLGSKNAQYAYIGAFMSRTGKAFPFPYDNDTSIYTAHAEGAGFDVDCEPYSSFHDLTPTAEQNVTHGRISSATVSYDLAQPPKMVIDVSYKNESSCAFHMLGKRCTLTAATKLYPVQVQMNISSSSYSGPFYSLQDGTSRLDDKTLKKLDEFEYEGQQNWTYMGIAKLLGLYYNSTIDIEDSLQDNITSSWNASGPLAAILGSDYDNSGTQDDLYCEAGFADGLGYLSYLHSLDEPGIDVGTLNGEIPSVSTIDFAELILNNIRLATFLSSVYTGAEYYTNLWSNDADDVIYPKDHYIQEVAALRSKVVAVYKVRLHLWVVSLLVTFAAVGIILPMLYGYWTLARKPSMSPINVARVFHAPVLEHLDPAFHTEGVLRAIGTRHVHDNLRGRVPDVEMRSPIEGNIKSPLMEMEEA